MQSTSIIRRWIRGSLLITVLVLVLAEGLFLYYSYNDLYGGVERAVENRFSTVVGRLQATGTAGDTATTAESRANVLRRVVEQFDEKDKFEFMLLDAQGVILATSSGTMNRDLTNGTDYGRALTSANGIGSAIFTTPQGERVMAVTMLVPYAAGSIAAMRMVTSLTLVDGLWWRTVAICVGLGVLVLAFTVWSGLFFVRSIVRPLGEVEATATKIAKGDMKVRLPDTRYDDEIGRLCKTINQMAEDLAETERLKNEFISSVSHELRTPLTSIRGWVETISNIDDPTNENYRRGLSIIGTETDRLYTMVEELLDFSRLQNGIKMNCEVLDFVAEATDAALFVEARIRQEGMQLVYSEPPEPYPVWADPARLRQVFVNLFDNAIKYSEPGGTIFLTLSRTPVTVSASIRDQGRGIAPDDLEKVKQKFFKAKNSVRGSGIGLAVVDEIVGTLGGKYGVQVQAVLKKAAALDIETVCSLHGPVLHKEQLGDVLAAYDTWSAYRPETEGVLVAYSSIYGHTAEAANRLAEALREKGVETVAMDLARCDMAEAVAQAFRFSKLVLATPTYNADVFPFMKEFIHHLTERNYQNRTVAFIENGSWAPMAAKVMTKMLEGSKNLTYAATTVTVRGALNAASEAQLAALADELSR